MSRMVTVEVPQHYGGVVGDRLDEDGARVIFVPLLRDKREHRQKGEDIDRRIMAHLERVRRSGLLALADELGRAACSE